MRVNVSVDFLIGEGEVANYDKAVLQRINDIEKLDKDTKSILFNLMFISTEKYTNISIQKYTIIIK